MQRTHYDDHRIENNIDFRKYAINYILVKHGYSFIRVLSCYEQKLMKAL